MNYCALFTPHHIAMVQDWLENAGSVFVHIEHPHSGASGGSYTIRSLSELRALIAKETHPEIEFFIFQGPNVSDSDLDRLLDHEWVYHNADRVLYIGVKKNCNWYKPFEQHPERYENSVREWRATG